MPNLSINELSTLTGRTRATVTKRLDGVPFLDGPKSAKLYDSIVALELIFQVGAESGEVITAAEASRQLTIARKLQIDLEMEVTRKARIALDAIELNNDKVLSNVAGLLKAHNGKQLDDTLIHDIFTELRGIGDVLKQ